MLVLCSLSAATTDAPLILANVWLQGFLLLHLLRLESVQGFAQERKWREISLSHSRFLFVEEIF